MVALEFVHPPRIILPGRQIPGFEHDHKIPRVLPQESNYGRAFAWYPVRYLLLRNCDDPLAAALLPAGSPHAAYHVVLRVLS